MAVNKIRQLGNKSVPKLLEKINYTDIVNTMAGGTGVPASAELVKNLFGQTNTETQDRINGDLAIIGGASIDYSTLSKIETAIKALKSGGSSDLATAISLLEGKITSEETARILADNAIDAKLVQEIADRVAAISAEKTARIAGDAAEKLARETAIAAEQVTRTTAINSVVSSLSQEVSDRQAAITNEELVRKTKDDALQANIDAEQLAREGAVNAEEAARIASDLVNSNAIAQEKVERQAGIATATAALVQETANRVAADSAHDARMSALESGMATGAKLKGTVETLADLDAFVESTQEEGWFYKIKTGTTGTSDVYMVAKSYNNQYDYQPSGWTTKGFVWLMDFADVTNAVTVERNERVLADNEIKGTVTLLEGKVNSIKSVTDSGVALLRSDMTNADAVLGQRIDTEIADRQTAVTNEENARIADVQSVRTALGNEVTARETAVANEAATRASAVKNVQDGLDAEVIARTTAVANEVSARQTAVSDEAAARTLADNNEKAARKAADALLQSGLDTEVADRTAAVATEKSEREAADTVINGKLAVIQGNKLVDGSIEKALFDAKLYVDNYVPVPMLEGADGNLLIVGDTVTLTYAPHRGLNGVAQGEVIVYLANGDSVMVTVLNVVGNQLILAAETAGEYNGLSVKAQYWFIKADQNGAGMGVSGEGGAGQ